MNTHDGTWTTLSVSEQTIRNSAAKLSERKNLSQPVHKFFMQAGTLMLYSWYSYPLASIAFFHTAIGVERSLRLTYGAKPGESFRSLFEKAVEEGIVHDGIFEAIAPLRKKFIGRVPHGPMSHSALLANMVPRLRNEYFHGGYIMSDDCLPLSLQMREVADALAAFKSHLTSHQ